jgi:serine/threonine protein kinase/WD40 repeat protein
MDRLASSAHPSVEKLRTFGLGQLEEGEASAIEEHVSQCEACCRTLAEAGSDTFTNLLRNSGPALPGVPTSEARTLAPDSPSPVAAGGQTAADSSAEPPSFGPPPELLRHPRYRLLGLLGTGGMGAVYKAEHRLMERAVALKVMTRAFVASEATVDRFRREVKAAARLAHPNIVAAYDAEQAGDVHFLVMEYVEGTDLARWLAEHGPLSVAEACDYARQCAAGLQHAHEHGMIHRDIKPHNLMRARDGTVKILDFGLARLAAEAGTPATGVTGQGTLLGTVDYLAPEQADDARQADIRSDIYSLGCTLYHLLSGRPPFPKGSVVQKIMAHTERQPASLKELRPDLPTGLVRVVQQMMAKSPDDRYQTPDEVCDALAPFAGQTVVIDPTPRGTKRPAKGKAPGGARRRRWSVVAAALLLALVGIGVGAAVYRIQTDNGELVITTDNPDVEVVIKQNGKLVRILDTKTNKEVKLDSGLYDLELKGNPEELKLSLDRVTIRRGDTVVATVERRARKAAEKVGLVRSFTWDTSGIQSAAFSPDGLRAASGDREGTVRLWDLRSGAEVRRLPDHAGIVYAVAFSPDGGKVVSGGDDNLLRLSDAATGKEIRTFVGHEKGVVRLTFSPDGKLLLSGDWGGALRLWDVESGKELRQFEGHTDMIHAVAFAPDGKTAASGSGDGTLRLWDPKTGKQLRSIDAAAGSVTGVAFSPDGRQVLTSHFDGALRWWDVSTGMDVRRFPVQTDTLQSVAILPGGRRAVTAGGGTVKDGNWRVGTDFTVRLWDVADGKEVQRFEGHRSVVSWVTVSPDGRYALSVGDGTTMHLWRLPDPPAK